MSKKLVLILLFATSLMFARTTTDEAGNIIKGSAYGQDVVEGNSLSGEDLLNKNKPAYYNETVLNWVLHYSASNVRGTDVMGKNTKMTIPYVVTENNASSSDNNATEVVSIKGYCYISRQIDVGKQAAAIRPDCQTNVGAITLMANLVNLNEKASLVVDPIYIEKNGVRFKVESAIVTNEAKTSYNIATFVNDRKIAEIGWGALSVGSEEFKTASNEYLKALEDSKKKQEVQYVTTSDGAGNSYMSPTTTTNTETPDPLDYLVKGAINLTASVVKNTADIFRKDLPYLYQVNKDTKIWIDLKVNKQGEYVK